jgi:elongation factor 1 alpha-like protein
MHVEVLKGRLQVPGKISELVATLDKGTGKLLKKKPRLVQPGSLARITLGLGTPVPLEAPGRVVLRANGETVAAGLLE